MLRKRKPKGYGKNMKKAVSDYFNRFANWCEEVAPEEKSAAHRLVAVSHKFDTIRREYAKGKVLGSAILMLRGDELLSVIPPNEPPFVKMRCEL